LGGCDPLSSFSLDSCVPAPVCKSQKYTWSDTKRVTSKTKYLGDSSKTDWVMDGLAVEYDNTLLLTMAPGTVGTVLATSTYMWYGNVKARFKTSRSQGVVTAFILLSDVKDEIDYEFVGADLETAQTNYYFQGITNCKFYLDHGLRYEIPANAGDRQPRWKHLSL
jgi:beta-glucanase (GH16 family)